MKRKLVLFWCMIFLSSVLLASCATTNLTFSRKNDEYTGGPATKIAVVGFAQKPAVRTLFEDEFVRELRARGVDAVPSYTVLVSDQFSDREAAVAKIKTLETDAVLATRVIGRSTVLTYAPTEYSVPYAYNSLPLYFGYVVSGGQVTGREEVVHLETNLYDTKTGQLIWTARSDTWLGDVQQTLIRSFAKTIIDKMVSDKVIK